MQKEQSNINDGKPDNTNPVHSTDMLNAPSILSGLSHEVRTYMNSIVAFTFLSNNESCTAGERDEYISHIMNSCDQLITLFDNFLDSALIDSEEQKSTITRCRLKALLKDLLNELNNSLSRFDRKKITLVLDESSGDDSMYIDKGKINRVLKNLFFNALDSTGSGYIKIGYNKHKHGVEFYVIDSGNGYTKNQELFSCKNLRSYLVRHQNTFTTVSLILSQKLIESMGGKFWIKQNGSGGTAIHFTVPEHTVMKNHKSENISSRIAI